MARKVIYWVTTILLAALSFLAAYGTCWAVHSQLRDLRTWAIPSSSALFWGLPNLLAGSPSSFPAWSDLRSGPMPDSHSLGSLHLLRTILPKMAPRHSLLWYVS